MMLRIAIVCLTIFTTVRCSPCGYNNNCTCTGQTMDCSNLGLKNISQICENVGNYTNLKANTNEIREIDKGDLHECESVQVIELNQNGLNVVDNDAFDEMTDLVYLDISNNAIANLYSDTGGCMFENLNRLVTLKINGNLNATEDGVRIYPDLSGLVSLSNLYLDGIKDKAFSVKFRNLTNLTNVSLSGFDGQCSLGRLQGSTFMQLHLTLRNLNISYCGIENIDKDTFQHLRHLEYLDLSYNQRLGFSVLANVSFSLQFTNIHFLNYSKMFNTFGTSNKLYKRDLCYLRNTTLHTLAFDSNRLAIIETNAIMLLPTTIEVVHLNDNVLNFSPYILQSACVPSLREIYASYQTEKHNVFLYEKEDYSISELVHHSNDDCPFMNDTYLKQISAKIDRCEFMSENSDDLFKHAISFPENLTKIVVRNCSLSYKIPRFIVARFPNNIRHIDVSGNIFYSFDGPVGIFDKLEHLDMSNNFCSNISNGFFYYTGNLTTLKLSNNFIGQVLSDNNKIDVFRGLDKLTALDLSLNRITTFNANIFAGLKELITLDLSWNIIKDIDVHLPPKLRDMNLRYNAVPSLSPSVIKHFKSMSSFSIDLRNNLISCSCKQRQFITWLMDNKQHFIGYKNYIFQNDDGQIIEIAACENFVSHIDKKCSSYTLTIVLATIGLSTSLSILFGGLIYKHRWKIRYFLYMSKSHFYGYQRLPDDDVIENYKYDAFISYAEENIRFILEGIIPNLEEAGLSLCIHQRDFIPGRAIADNIIDAIKSSRRTVIILSERFVRRKWCLYEFHMARMESIYSRSRQSALVIVMFENVPMRKMPQEMLDWINEEAYLEYSDEPEARALFWDRLSHAIRH